MSELKEMEREEAERSNAEGRPEVYRKRWLILANGVEKSDIWLLVVFPAEIQGKRSLEVWVWEGTESREEVEGGWETGSCSRGRGSMGRQASYKFSAQGPFQEQAGDLAKYSKQPGFRGVSSI